MDEQPNRTPHRVPAGEPVVTRPTTRPVPARVTRPLSVQDGARPDLPDFITRATRR